MSFVTVDYFGNLVSDGHATFEEAYMYILDYPEDHLIQEYCVDVYDVSIMMFYVYHDGSLI